MDAQRRYEVKVILDQLGTASSELRRLAGEEETTFKLMGRQHEAEPESHRAPRNV